MGAKVNSAEEGLRPENFGELNEQFYAAEPWRYFQQRLAHLMLVAADSDRYRAIFSEGVRLASVELTFEHAKAGGQDSPTVEQSFVAVEAEVLLHHAAETLLRFVHAHAEEDLCPWLRMSRLTGVRRLQGLGSLDRGGSGRARP